MTVALPLFEYEKVYEVPVARMLSSIGPALVIWWTISLNCQCQLHTPVLREKTHLDLVLGLVNPLKRKLSTTWRRSFAHHERSVGEARHVCGNSGLFVPGGRLKVEHGRPRAIVSDLLSKKHGGTFDIPYGPGVAFDR